MPCVCFPSMNEGSARAPESQSGAKLPARMRKIVEAALPGAQILRAEALGPDSATNGESSKGAGYGIPFRVDLVHQGIPRSVVLHTATSNAFGHDRRADRAAAAVLAADTFGNLPHHVEVLDVGAYARDDDFVSLRDTDEFYVLTSFAEGRAYASDLRRLARTGLVTTADMVREHKLVEYLSHLHARRVPHEKTRYERFVRDTLGSGEGVFGITDGYPDDAPGAPRARLEAIEESCLRWRFRLRRQTQRLRRTHGDFHPFNVVFDERSELSVLDASRGGFGDPADDVSCMSINYAFFSLGSAGAWREALGPMWRRFWSAYLTATRDEALVEVVAPLFAWRGLVLASPAWYPELTAEDRNRVLSFVEHVLAAPRFAPEMASEFFDT